MGSETYSHLTIVVTLLSITTTITHGEECPENVVASNGAECAEIGMSMFRHGGSAVDAAIATLFCEGVTGAQSSGLGGGFFATIYQKKTGTIKTLIAREQAPSGSTADMFVGKDSVTGILAVGIPGELKGYQALHKEYGKLKWAKLVEPTIKLCHNGYKVNDYLFRSLQSVKNDIYLSSSLRPIFWNDEKNDTVQLGDLIKRPLLKKTLETIAIEGADTMYTKDGKIANKLVEEIQRLGGIINMTDLTNYTIEWKEPIIATLKGDYTLNTVPYPASGAILALILNILNGFTASISVDYYHLMVESFKFAYGARSQLGDNDTLNKLFSSKEYADELRDEIDITRTYNDPLHYHGNYITQNHGTQQISVLAANGDAVSVTSTINTVFGSKIRSLSTGIILNDQMDDFGTPNKTNSYGFQPSPSNFIAPWKRPLSSMCPTIIIDKNKDVIFAGGAGGGSTITTSVAYIITRHFGFKESLKDAITAPRLHHQLLPMVVQYENGFDETILQGLREKGHNVTLNKISRGFNAATAISRLRGNVEAEFDPRRDGSRAIESP